jgi:uncharacterized integral membrane protein
MSDLAEQPTVDVTSQTGSKAQPAPVSTKEVEPDETDERRSRVGAGMVILIVSVVLGVALIAFIVQNTRSVQIKFFGASGHIPVSVALLGAALIGAVIVLGANIFRSTQLKIAARKRWKRKTEYEEKHPSSDIV